MRKKPIKTVRWYENEIKRLQHAYDTDMAAMKSQNIVLRNQNDNSDANINFYKKEFARAFGWSKKKSGWDDEGGEPITPTWPEIFVKLGKIINNADDSDVRREFRNLREMVEYTVGEIKSAKNLE